MGFFGGGASVNLASPPAIGNTTPNTGAFTTLTLAPSANTTPFTASGYSLTGTNAQSLFDLSGTWNTSGTPTAFKLNITDTASNASSLLMDLQVGGTSRFGISKNGMIIARDSITSTQAIIATGSDGNYSIGYNNGGFFFRINSNIIGGFGLHGSTSILSMSFGSAHFLGWQSGSYGGNTDPDLKIFRDGAGILAQRNSTNAQTFRIYNTFTDASNYERGFMRWATNVLEIGAEAAGTGTLTRTVRITAYSTIDFYNTQYGYSMGSVAGGNWTFNAGAQITNICRMDSNYGFQAASTRTFGWVSSTNTAVAPDTALYRNAAGVVEVNNGTAGTFRDLIVRNFRMSAPTLVPASASATGSEGQISWDASYIYVCTATNTWKRVAIATW